MPKANRFVITDADINEFTSDANQKNKLSLADIKNRRIQNGGALKVRRRQRLRQILLRLLYSL